MPGSTSETMSCHASQCSIDFQVQAPSRSRWCGPWSSHVTRTVPNSIASSYTRRAKRTDSSFGIASSSPFRSRRGYWIRNAVSPSAAASDAFVLSIVRKNTPLRKSMPRRNALNWSRIIESAFTIVRPSGDRWSSFITTPGMTRRIQFTLSLYGRMWIRWNSSRRCSPRIEAYRMFVSTPRMMSSYSARRRAIAVSPIGSTKPAQSRAEFSQSRYSGESSRTLTWYDVAVPPISTSGYSSFDPPVPMDATVNRSTRPLIAPRASCSAGNSAICPFSRSSRKLTLRLREEPVDHPLRVEAADVLVRLSEVHEHDRLPDRLRHRERRAALRVRVDLCQDDPIEADGLVKLLRLLDRVVAGEGVADVQDQVRFRDALDLLHLVHQVLVRLHAARGVDQDDVPPARPRVLDRVEGDRRGIGACVVFDQLEADRLGVLLKLLDRPRPERIRRGDDTRVAFLHDVVRELRDRRRLAGPVHADEHHDEGTWALLDQAEEVEGRHRQRLRDCVPQRHLDAVFEAHLPRDPLPPEVLREAVHDLLGDRERHVRLEEGDLEVVQDLLELVFLDLAAGVANRLGRHLGFGLLFPAGEPLSERLEHLAPLARCARSLQPVVQVLDGGAVGLRPPLQIPEALPDRVGRLGDRFDSGVEPFDLSVHVIVGQEVGADRDERLVDILRLGDEERIRADWHEDFRGFPRFPIPHEGLAGPHVLLEGDADDLLLLRQRFDLRPVLIEDRDSPAEFGLPGAHARASNAYRTA